MEIPAQALEYSRFCGIWTYNALLHDEPDGDVVTNRDIYSVDIEGVWRRRQETDPFYLIGPISYSERSPRCQHEGTLSDECEEQSGSCLYSGSAMSSGDLEDMKQSYSTRTSKEGTRLLESTLPISSSLGPQWSRPHRRNEGQQVTPYFHIMSPVTPKIPPQPERRPAWKEETREAPQVAGRWADPLFLFHTRMHARTYTHSTSARPSPHLRPRTFPTPIVQHTTSDV